ncbi:MAG: hypothetical protein M3Q46_14535 [Verrucomicrobiota bacterium]|nr:hypothetical protein [Verrucomicrobiota bacterium]
MSKAKCYSPQLERAVLRALYFEAKARHIPMTELANALIKSGLSRTKAPLPDSLEVGKREVVPPATG